MKREVDGGEMGSPNKRFRRGDEEVRLLIPSKVAGSIIGKGGQNITKLRSQYKASITVPDCPGPERMLTLSSDLDTICNIISDVVPNLEDNGAKVNGNDLDLRMMIHQSQAGCVIGRAGQKIKEIRDKTGARIKIFSNCAPQSTDRVIQIVGQPQKCIQSVREIIALIKTTAIKGPINPYDPHNFDDFYAEEYGGYGSGGAPAPDARRGPGGPPPPPRGGGLGGPPPLPRTGAPGGRYNNRGPPPIPPLRGGGGGSGGGMNNFNERGLGGAPPPRSSFGAGPPPRALNGGGGGGSSSFESSRGGPWGPPANGGGGGGLMGQPPAPSGMLPPAPGGPSGGGLGSGGSGGGVKTSTQVTIPKELAGAIIGKGGGRIRKIRQDSGAGITIDEPLPGSNDRVITITGLQNQIQMAQYLLQQSVHNNAERHNY